MCAASTIGQCAETLKTVPPIAPAHSSMPDTLIEVLSGPSLGCPSERHTILPSDAMIEVMMLMIMNIVSSMDNNVRDEPSPREFTAEFFFDAFEDAGIPLQPATIELIQRVTSNSGDEIMSGVDVFAAFINAGLPLQVSTIELIEELTGVSFQESFPSIDMTSMLALMALTATLGNIAESLGGASA